MLDEIQEKMDTAMKIIQDLGYKAEDVSAKEFYYWMTGENTREESHRANHTRVWRVLEHYRRENGEIKQKN